MRQPHDPQISAASPLDFCTWAITLSSIKAFFPCFGIALNSWSLGEIAATACWGCARTMWSSCLRHNLRRGQNHCPAGLVSLYILASLSSAIFSHPTICYLSHERCNLSTRLVLTNPLNFIRTWGHCRDGFAATSDSCFLLWSSCLRVPKVLHHALHQELAPLLIHASCYGHHV